MTIEEIRGGVEFDEFPKGMRVLAVDDDPTCLKLLDGLLRKCQYQVTTTSQARTALNMLRENRNRFDLIISDVHMPDMDGFKLLELVGLEMDLPVIMLSVNSDPKLVMKGIVHGACDYLVKPVRIEELRNIWQHVIRKKKVASKPRNKSNSHDKDQLGSDGGQATVLTGIADQNGKLNRKKKDEEEEGDENDNEDDDPSTQKKPRVVWSIELHRKFVAAVNQLGLEKAVPKRILDLMNEEGLTRENVASHLQKYRLYLKRISLAASQQANMVAAFGKDASYLRMGSLDGLGDFRTLAGGSGRLLQNSGLSPYAPSGMLGRLNSLAGINLQALNSSSVAQSVHSQNLSNPINAMEKFQPILSPAHQNPKLFSGIQASSLELNQFQHSKSVSHVAEFSLTDDHRNFTAVNTFTDNRAAVGSSSNLLSNGPSTPFMLQGNTPQVHNGVGFVNQFSINNASLNSEPFNISARGSSSALEDGICHENWQNSNAFQLTKFSSCPLLLSDPFSNAQMPSSKMISRDSTQSIHNQNSPINFRSNSAISAPLEDSRESHSSMVGSLAPNLNQANQLFRQHKLDYAHNSNNAFGTINSPTPGNAGVVPFSGSMDHINGVYNQRMDAPSIVGSNGSALTLVQIEDAEKLGRNVKLRTNEGYLLEHPKLQGNLLPNNCDPSDDLMNAVMKQEQDGTMLMVGEFGFDNYSFGSCI